ncbi:MAG: DNA-3-methyladenine glycosylase, partial [Planctomycetes bacterium]|nr:DNA-3-methyladenine glycosylase [Planctomycetota bacterium]
YYCMNVVTEPEDHASAVLLRAVEPVRNITERTSGPGLLCKAMHIDRRHQGHDLESDDLYIAHADSAEEFSTIARPRIGVDYAGKWAEEPLRFYIQDNPFVSRK